MAYSTSHYFVKPIVPRITIGVTINGINLIQFNAKSMLLLSDVFSDSLNFYYMNDIRFKKSLDIYMIRLRTTEKEISITRSEQKYEPVTFEVSENISEILDLLSHCLNSPVSKGFRQNDLIEHTSTRKLLKYWLKKTYKYREKQIRRIYPKKKYFEMYSLLNACNSFLKKLGEISLNLTNSLDPYFEIGQDIDWLLLNVTECPYHEAYYFKLLFDGNVRVKNDLTVIAGIFNILTQEGILELYMNNDKNFNNRLVGYKEKFHELLISGNEIINLKNNIDSIIEMGEKTLEEHKIEQKMKDRNKELTSMHDLVIDKKIREIK